MIALRNKLASLLAAPPNGHASASTKSQASQSEHGFAVSRLHREIAALQIKIDAADARRSVLAAAVVPAEFAFAHAVLVAQRALVHARIAEAAAAAKAYQALYDRLAATHGDRLDSPEEYGGFNLQHSDGTCSFEARVTIEPPTPADAEAVDRAIATKLA